MSRGKGIGKSCYSGLNTLCWDCAHATDSNECAWCADGIPVDGWVADEIPPSRRTNKLGSYHVRWCPKFKRDAENAGLKKWESKLEYEPLKGENDGNSNHNEHRPSDAQDRVVEPHGDRPVGCGSGSVADKRGGETRSVVTCDRNIEPLAFVILERAVLDWKALEYGMRNSVLLDGILVDRKEVVHFFFGEWFKHLCDVTPWTPEQFRRLIKMPDNALDIVEYGDAGKEFYYATLRW